MKKELLRKFNDEIAFAQATGMPQFVAGLLQARKIIEQHEDEQTEAMRNYIGSTIQRYHHVLNHDFAQFGIQLIRESETDESSLPNRDDGRDAKGNS